MKAKLAETISNPIDKSNRGYKLLQKLGFKEGESLGKSNNGIIDPLKPEIKTNNKAGIGNEPSTDSDKKDPKKEAEIQLNHIFTLNYLSSKKLIEIISHKNRLDKQVSLLINLISGFKGSIIPLLDFPSDSPSLNPSFCKSL